MTKLSNLDMVGEGERRNGEWMVIPLTKMAKQESEGIGSVCVC